jgi:hypothetical protein
LLGLNTVTPSGAISRSTPFEFLGKRLPEILDELTAIASMETL